ncbi:MAG: DUF3122 domain-containing protein [Coleofasciculaceae cyanobacterium]
MLCFIVPIRRLLGWGVLLFLLLSQILTQPAWADLRLHQDAPGVMRYHSQQSLRDASGNALQVVLFKQITPGKPTQFHLRLVGFPGIVEFLHPQRLEVITNSGQILTAVDVYAEGAPAANVGEYNFTEILAKLSPKDAPTLAVQLKGARPLSLKIPKSLAQEWQLLADQP